MTSAPSFVRRLGLRRRGPKVVRPKSPGEEKANQLTHGLGLVLSVLSLLLLYRAAEPSGDPSRVLSFLVFGLSISLLYFASFAYHSAKTESLKRRLKILDHAAIYVLIAGSYTPFMSHVLAGGQGRVLLYVVWILAALGLLFKFYFAHRFKLASTLIYLAMGWLVLFVIGPLTEALSTQSLVWLVAGGMCYTTGVIFYLWDRLPYQHAVWHLFVLGGTACHVAALIMTTQ